MNTLTTKWIIIPISQKNISLAYNYYKLLEKDGLASSSFPAGDVQSAQDFCGLALDLTNTTYIIYAWSPAHTRVYQEPVAHLNLNNWNGKTAHAHFSVLRKLHGKGGIQMGRNVIQQIFTMRTAEGSSYIKNMVGYTPVKNALACRYTLAVGFKKLAILEDGYQLADNTLCDAMISIARKE